MHKWSTSRLGLLALSCNEYTISTGMAATVNNHAPSSIAAASIADIHDNAHGGYAVKIKAEAEGRPFTPPPPYKATCGAAVLAPG